MGQGLTTDQKRLVARRKGVNPTYDDVRPQAIPGYHCNVRIYPSGNWTWEPRSKADQEEYLEHNRTFRPGCAIFVDGELVAPSWLADRADEAAAIGRRLARHEAPCDARNQKRLARFG